MCKMLLLESCKAACMFSCHHLKWAWSDHAVHSGWDSGTLKEKIPLPGHSAGCCSGCFLPEQDFGLLLGRGNTTGTQKLRQGWSLATPRDHHTIKTAQLAPAPPWKTRLSSAGLAVGSCVAVQCWSAALPALQSCYQPRDEELKIKVLKGSAWDEGTSLKELSHTAGNCLCILGHEGCWNWWEQQW